MQNSSDNGKASGSHSSDSEVIYAGSSDSNQRRSIAPLPLDEAERMLVPSVPEAPVKEELPPASGADGKDGDTGEITMFGGVPVKINPEPSFDAPADIDDQASDADERSVSYWQGFYRGLASTRAKEREESPAAEETANSPKGWEAIKSDLEQSVFNAQAAASHAKEETDETVFNNPGSGRTVSSSSEYIAARDPNKANNTLSETPAVGKGKKNDVDPQQGKIISFLSFVNKKQNKETKKLTAEEQLDNLQKEAQAEEEKQKTPQDYFKLIVHVTFVICFITILILICLTYIWPDYLSVIFLSPASAQAILLALMLYLTFDISCQVEPGNFRTLLLIGGLVIITELAILLKYI